MTDWKRETFQVYTQKNILLKVTRTAHKKNLKLRTVGYITPTMHHYCRNG